jgi:hypothetical protein
MAMLFEPRSREQQQNENDDHPLFGLGEDEQIQEPLHFSE